MNDGDRLIRVSFIGNECSILWRWVRSNPKARLDTELEAAANEAIAAVFARNNLQPRGEGVLGSFKFFFGSDAMLISECVFLDLPDTVEIFVPS